MNFEIRLLFAVSFRILLGKRMAVIWPGRQAMIKKAAVGKQDFSEIIEGNYFYVDKTSFIKEWWENGDDVTLITRPRRFGKTLTMRMVEQFFSVKYAGRGRLFHGLKIWKEEKYQKLQGTYPVIYLSFAIIKEDTFEKTKKKICQLIANLYASYSFLLNSESLTENDKVFFKKVSADMDDVTATMALYQLSISLRSYYGKNVIILLDEYDTPMQEAYLKGYWEELVSFARSLLNAAFKSNPCLERAILTGITRVSKESIFSDLNNLKIVTVTSKPYASVFGFTEDEVFAALEEYGLLDQKEDVRQWYDGFKFGGCDHIYNPWSVVNFLAEREISSYWANTSSNGLVKNLIQKRGKKFQMILEDLLIQKTFQVVMNEEIIFSQLDRKESAAWSLLLASGYLKVINVERCPNGKKKYTLSVTNTEVCTVFDEIVTEIFSSSESDYSDFSDALLSGDKKFMNEYVNTVAAETFSFYDTGTHPSEYRQSENFYHGFVLGLIADLRGKYHVASNRESGLGRYDVLLEPANPALDDGIILEFKVQESAEASLQDTVRSAIDQIIEKKYAADLISKGICRDRIRIYGFAFRGKDVFIDGGWIREYENNTHS